MLYNSLVGFRVMPANGLLLQVLNILRPPVQPEFSSRPLSTAHVSKFQLGWSFSAVEAEVY